MERKRADQAVVEALKKENVEYVFGLPGGHSCHILYDALYDAPEIKSVLVRHEGAAAFAALAYAQLTGKVAFCTGTAGPGWAQMLPGVHEAWTGKIPMIAYCPKDPQVSSGKGNIQEFPQSESMIPFTKWTCNVERADKIGWIMRRAFTHALSLPPGPVGINFPMDLGGEYHEYEEYKPAPKGRYAADPTDAARAADMLLAAERPVIVAGRGIHQAAAWGDLREFAEMLAIPVLETNGGKGAISETHPLYAGGVGINFISVSQKIYNESDCMFWIGSQIEEFAAAGWAPIEPGVKFIHSDADPTQFGRNWVPDLYLAGDAKLVLQQLIAACRDRVAKKNFQGHPKVAEIGNLWKEYARQMRELAVSEKGTVHPLQILDEVQARMPDDTVLVLGEGSNRVWTASHLRLKTPGRFVSTSDYGCMGFSVPAAIGAKLAKPESQIISITGDGSFQMQMQELPVAVQYKTPVTWIIMNNLSLGWIKWYQDRFFDGRYIDVDYSPGWRFDKVAEAAGCLGIKVDRPEDMQKAMAEALDANRKGIPAVLDVITPVMAQTPHFPEHHSPLSG